MTEDRSSTINRWLAVWEANQLYAYNPDQGEGRRMWAETALYALARASDAGLDRATVDVSRFNLRAWVITNLGANDDPLWNPDMLGADILQALPLGREQAEEWSRHWRRRPRSEILDLRRCKSLLGPANIIRMHLAEIGIGKEIDQWLALRSQLP